MIEFSDVANSAREMLASGPLPVVDKDFSMKKGLNRLTDAFIDSARHGTYDPLQLFGMGDEINKICREMTGAYECQGQFARTSNKRSLEWFCYNSATGFYSSVSNPDVFEEGISASVSPVADKGPAEDSTDSAYSTASASELTQSLTTARSGVVLPFPYIEEDQALEFSQHGDICKTACENEAGQTCNGNGSSQPATTGYHTSRKVTSWLETVLEPSNTRTVVSIQDSTRTTNLPSDIWDINTRKAPFVSPESYNEAPDTPLEWCASEAEASFVFGDMVSPSSYKSGPSDILDCLHEIAQSIVTAYISQSTVIAYSVATPGRPFYQRSRVTRTHDTAHGNPPILPDGRSQPLAGAIGRGSQVGSTTGTSRETQQSTPSTSPSTSRTNVERSSRKREVTGDSEDAEEDALEGSKYPKRLKSSTSEVDCKLLACPYFKFDRRRYSADNLTEINYRKCSNCCLRGIHRLKQHLHRVHRRPDHYCPCCFVAFKTQGILQTHVRSRACESVDSPFEEKMTYEQLMALKRRVTGREAYDAWYDIFEILFPEAPLPLSPYVESAHSFTVNDFLVFFDSEAQGILRREVNYRMLGDNPVGLESQFLDGVWTESLSILVQYLEDRVQKSSGASGD